MVAGNGGRPQPLRRSFLCSGSPLRGLESNKGVSEAMEVLFGGGHPEKHNRVFELRPLTIYTVIPLLRNQEHHSRVISSQKTSVDSDLAPNLPLGTNKGNWQWV